MCSCTPGPSNLRDGPADVRVGNEIKRNVRYYFLDKSRQLSWLFPAVISSRGPALSGVLRVTNLRIRSVSGGLTLLPDLQVI